MDLRKIVEGDVIGLSTFTNFVALFLAFSPYIEVDGILSPNDN